MVKSGIAIGMNKGHVVTKREVVKPSQRVGAKGKRVALCREIARECAGLVPYERRILDMIKTGGTSAEKRIYKFAKRRLGTHKRAVAKREDVKAVHAAMRARAGAH
jgi:large subunit ribosomal protein L36e